MYDSIPPHPGNPFLILRRPIGRIARDIGNLETRVAARQLTRTLPLGKCVAWSRFKTHGKLTGHTIRLGAVHLRVIAMPAACRDLAEAGGGTCSTAGADDGGG
jgi:hypothetical protein